ncbi:MAG: hypothetical protein ACKV2T_13760 [Kofleriaceae bacterium]
MESHLRIYDDATARPRFEMYVHDARLLFYVDRDALQTLGGALVQPSPVAAPKELFTTVGFVPTPGTPVQILERVKDRFVKVRVVTYGIEVTGFLATSSIGTMFQNADVERPAWKPNTLLPAGATLLDKPNGAVFAMGTAEMNREAMIHRESRH